MIGRLRSDGSITDIGWREARDGDIDVDEIASHRPGDRLILDPQNPRRAIPDAGALERRATAARLEAAIAAKQRQMALARLTVEDEFPGAAEAQTKLDVEIKAMAAVADAAGDWPAVEALKG